MRSRPWPTTTLVSWSARVGLSRADALGVSLAVAVGACTLAYPFGHDQGVHFYVGREWLEHGALPYRDAFDYKPPGIFLIHALLIAVFGEHQWPIRLAELCCVLALGGAARALLPPTPPRGSFGVSCFAASLLYFGFFNFWDTAQCEIWSATFALLGLASVRNSPSLRACAFGGLFSGLALLMKTPTALFVLVTLFVAMRRPEASVRGVALFLTTALLPPAMCVAYFAARGGLFDLYDVLVRATGAYVVQARRVDSAAAMVRECVGVYRSFDPYATAIAAALGYHVLRGLSRGAWEGARRYALPAALTIAGFAAVAAQLKFYHYHTALLVAPAVLFVGHIFTDVTRAMRDGARARRVPAAFVAVLMLAFPLSGPPAWSWLETNVSTIGWVAGTVSEDTFSARFAIPGLYYSSRDSALVASWLSAHTEPEDMILVRGFESEIYALARRRAPGRFFWTLPFTDPMRAYRREEWTAEDRRLIERTLPRFVVALSALHEGPDSAEYFAQFGYSRRVEIGRLTILSRVGG